MILQVELTNSKTDTGIEKKVNPSQKNIITHSFANGWVFYFYTFKQTNGMNIIFDDNKLHLTFAPLTLTRPVADLRVGILTICESWIAFLKPQFPDLSVSYLTEKYLNAKYPASTETGLFIAGNVKPTAALVRLVSKLKEGEELIVNGHWVARFGENCGVTHTETLENKDFICLTKIWHLFQQNGNAIKSDFQLVTKGKTTQHLSSSNRVIGSNEIFIEPGAKIECAILNATDGPIYVGCDAEIMEGSVIRAPFALGDHAVIKMSAKIYGDTTIGAHCKVGGEISNSIFYAYSNKGHDGFVGNSLIGEWCNLGADTNTSNLKNNYSNVRVYSYELMSMEASNETFCGVIMGDHAKTGINTMLNTATSVGVSANVFGAGFPPKFIKSFSWGGAEGLATFEYDKATEVAQNMMKRRSIELSEADKSILNYLFKSLA